jgi:hypothetical protein
VISRQVLGTFQLSTLFRPGYGVVLVGSLSSSSSSFIKILLSMSDALTALVWPKKIKSWLES